MVKLKVKVGPKGQIVVPKILREAYGIKENGYVVLEPLDDGIKIRGLPEPEEIIEWIRARRQRLKSRSLPARLGDLKDIDLEEEFED